MVSFVVFASGGLGGGSCSREQRLEVGHGESNVLHLSESVSVVENVPGIVKGGV